MSPEELYSKMGPTPSERAVVTCEQGEIRLFVYHGSDRMSAPLTRERATALAHDILSKVLESSR